MSELLPTGTVTLLLADVEGSTRLWETQPEEMTAAVARLDQAVSDVIAAHDGVRPVEQGEGDSFVVAFARARDAVACALELQRAPLAPIRLRIGVHTGEVQLRDEGNYIGPTINRTARLRDLAHGGQTVLSGATEALVLDRLPADAWLTDLGTHPLRDLPRPERVVQLCHPDLRNEFPPLRRRQSCCRPTSSGAADEFRRPRRGNDEVRRAAGRQPAGDADRCGRGRARHVWRSRSRASMAGEFGDGVWYVDLAPITDPELVPVDGGPRTRAARPARPLDDGHTAAFVGDRQMLVVLDNCEHLLDASAGAGRGAARALRRQLTLLATSREPIGVAGEVSWRVPSLSLADEAIELFADRARRVRPDFAVTDDNAATVAEICARLDGMPLAIELAAARVRALSLAEILDSLHDRFRLLTGGARTAVRRQQTLRASVDWSHALLTEPERVLFRRLAVFLGGFDLDAAQAVAGGGDVERYQVLDQLTLLVDKSLVVAENSQRPNAIPAAGDGAPVRAGEARRVRRSRRRAGAPPRPLHGDGRRCSTRRQAVTMSSARAGRNRDRQPARRVRVEPRKLRHRAGVDAGVLAAAAVAGAGPHPGRAGLVRRRPRRPRRAAPRGGGRGARAGARRQGRARHHGSAPPTAWIRPNKPWRSRASIDDPALLARALTACGFIASGYDAEVARPYFAEAIGLARAWTTGGGSARSSPAGHGANVAGDPIAAARGRRRRTRPRRRDRRPVQLASVPLLPRVGADVSGDLAGAAAQFGEVAAEAEAAHDDLEVTRPRYQGFALAYQGEAAAARAAAEAALEAAAELGGLYRGRRLRRVWRRGPGRRRCCDGARGATRRPGST